MSGDTMTFAEQVAADPRSYWYLDRGKRPRWGDRRSAKWDDVRASPFAKRLLNPDECDEAGVEYPCLMTSPPLLPQLQATPAPAPARAETPATPPTAAAVPDYDQQAAELPADEAEDEDEEGGLDMAAAMADPAQLMQVVELASDGLLDLLVYLAYIGSPVPEKPPTARERKVWRDALVTYGKSKVETAEVTPEMLLFGTVAVIMGPRVAQGQSHHVVKLVKGMQTKRAAAQKRAA